MPRQGPGPRSLEMGLDPAWNEHKGPICAVLVDDDAGYSRLQVDLLRTRGIDCLAMQDPKAALQYLLGEERCDVILLDARMPEVTGFEFLTQFRKAGGMTPVIMVSGEPGDEIRVRGIDLGAEDFLVKPFSIVELEARIHLVLRRASQRQTRWRIGNWILDCVNHSAHIGVTRIELSPKEFAFLATMAQEHGKSVSRSELLQQIWGLSRDPGTRILEVLASRLRKKMRKLTTWVVHHDLTTDSYALLDTNKS